MFVRSWCLFRFKKIHCALSNFNLGDIAKNHLDLVLGLFKKWQNDSSPDRNWVIRHALRYIVKKRVMAAIRFRKNARS